jgi:hypothetical protein
LLWIALAAKILRGCSIIYDIRENYFRNILYTNAFPPVIRVFIALYVRIKERITSAFINFFFLAEAGYARELSFVGSRKIILENKLKKVDLPLKQKWSAVDQQLHLLFTGTLAITTGVFVAIDIATKLHSVNPAVRLHIVGFSPIPAIQREIEQATAHKDFIYFQNSRKPVSHLDILAAIQQADVGIIAYPPNVSTENTIPTKLYEYMGYALPILLIDHAPWVERCRPYNAAIPFNTSNFDADKILTTLRETPFYSSKAENVFWHTEEPKLLQSIAAVLK